MFDTFDRRRCGRLGALTWITGLALWCGLACLLASVFRAGEGTREIVRTFYIAMGVALFFGYLAGVIRYQMKRGTSEEQAGGGGCAQISFAIPIALIYFPTIVFPGLLLLFGGMIFKKDWWGDGTSGYIAPITALSWAFLLAGIAAGYARDKDDIGCMCTAALVGAISSADHFLCWMIFRLGDRGMLSRPADPALRARFHLSELLFGVMAWGAYLAGLMWIWRWTADAAK